MTYGLKTVNSSGIVSIDEDATSYVYLGKIQIGYGTEYYVHCVGYPLIFFQVPHNVYGSPPAGGNYNDYLSQGGVAMRRLRQAPGDPNTWIITISGGGPNLYLRVFGLLHMNFPNGSGEQYGARLRNAQGQLSFDTGCRQLRLAGNSYDTEMTISAAVANEVSGNGDVGTTAVGLPFDMGNKSIMANTRGTIVYPYTYNAYSDWETGQDRFDIVWFWIDTLFSSVGNVLYARKSAIATWDQRDSASNPSVFLQYTNVYTRVAVIDNNLFP